MPCNTALYTVTEMRRFSDKTAVIDIGSNSVRLAMMAGGKTLYKKLATTRLGESVEVSGALRQEAIERTALAVAGFVGEAADDGAARIYAFATAAVRSSSNGGAFVKRVKELCGIDVDVLSGETEAQTGLLGALKGEDGGIIDVGGASTEITVQSGGRAVYTKSVNIGTVRLHDIAGRDRDLLESAIEKKLAEYGSPDLSPYNMYTIGGTASRLAALRHGLTEYRPEITDGTRITQAELAELTDRMLTLPVEVIRETTICRNSADIVGGGCLLMLCIMKRFNIAEMTVSESDNLEGYCLIKERAR